MLIIAVEYHYMIEGNEDTILDTTQINSGNYNSPDSYLPFNRYDFVNAEIINVSPSSYNGTMFIY